MDGERQGAGEPLSKRLHVDREDREPGIKVESELRVAAPCGPVFDSPQEDADVDFPV